MLINRENARRLLKNADLRRLFVEELGWDHHHATFEGPLGNRTYTLTALAHKRGMVAFHCPSPAGERLPDHAERRKIEQYVAKTVHEHLIIFTDAEGAHQVWQWVRREPGKPTACREHHYHRSQTGEALLQKLEAIAFSLDEEERIALPDVTGRVRAAFDVERVTRRFYEEFRKQQVAFLKSIEGIPAKEDCAWYASVMLNRLMFLYFIQRKGFLDGDPDYLRNRLRYTKEKHGKDRFYSFYRYFLLRLFHEGLSKKDRSPELEELVGGVPHLNGGIFDVHPLEQPDRYGNQIQIPDEAFERIFDYFDRYQWHLDERPLRADNEINPDVLGYIFEKYVNQKQMGAYYTKEDITEYISKNTVIPFLFEAACQKCKIAFDNPDRYIYPAVKHGVIREDGSIAPETELPDFVQVGMHDPKARMFDKRYNLEQAEAGDPIRLVTETWREYVYRRNRCLEIRQKLQRGEVRDINDLITLNLDIRQFAQDVIETCEGPELLRAFWHAIETVTVLDPTCGSGAFLFAALNILEPLYEACLERMEAFVEDLERSGVKHRPEKFADFRKVLNRMAAHPNRRYFIFKSIILNNLYGVDIMEEAVEICKLRLFLKLAAQVEPDPSHPNLGIEPLPDIDFNIRAGNTLVGFATYDEVEKAVTAKLDFDKAMERIQTKAADLQQAFEAFRARQMEGDESVPLEHKLELRRRLAALNEELNHYLYLAKEYVVNPSNKDAYDKWLKSHQPFHWFVEFYGIIKDGGFDVIIGNPPYVEYKEVRDTYIVQGFLTQSCGNLYAFTLERSLGLAGARGRIGMIVPVAAICTEGYAPLQGLLREYGTLVASSFNDRPSKLFDGLEHSRLCIILEERRDSDKRTFSSTYNKWQAVERLNLFERLAFKESTGLQLDGAVAKIGSSTEVSVLNKLSRESGPLAEYTAYHGKYAIYYTRKLSHFVQILNFIPSIKGENGRKREPSELKQLLFSNEADRDVFLAILNSSLFYWLITVFSDCRNLNKREVHAARFDMRKARSQIVESLRQLSRKLMDDIQRNSHILTMNYKRLGTLKIQCTYPRLSKPIIDEIDYALAKHYGFTDEELDFIINYDIKYRMGRDAGEEQESK
ncbi:MAG: SAM-dependent methyltransferase [Clostridia bacterium]|nr:MAG: SAM-dependent methyltransferase [Clostridia bacterium]